ncbi:hypothetical protein UU7_01112 [Rhodanobacter spathiphylli B39]|uniref:Uncharacterized protein n=2 Tax=Rhodanobacter TaxID=75309 RepID=I4W5H6_9GAMM|nr:hypothetical protein UU7_01112 [Rhodanobacter spathiphylli B39]
MESTDMVIVPDEEIDFSKTLVGKDPIGPLSKLLWECQQIHAAKDVDPLVRMFMSQNAAASAWHLTDWIWVRCPPERLDDLRAAVRCKGDQFSDFASAVREASLDVAICRQLATAGKHVSVKRGEMKNLSIEVEHNEDKNQSSVWICLDGKRSSDNDVYAGALRWWIDLYIHVGFPEAQNLLRALGQRTKG